jgi:hypothetical protein
MKPSILRLLAIGAGAMLLTSAYVRVPSSNVMETAAKNFLNSLTPEQRAKATYKFEDDQRFDWHFIPKPRKGLPLREMTTYQTKLAHALLAAGLSQHGYIKAIRKVTSSPCSVSLRATACGDIAWKAIT